MYQKKNWLEQVQRGVARFATRPYSRQEGCVTQALNHWSIEGLSEQTNINVQDTTWPSSNQYTTLCET